MAHLVGVAVEGIAFERDQTVENVLFDFGELLLADLPAGMCPLGVAQRVPQSLRIVELAVRDLLQNLAVPEPGDDVARNGATGSRTSVLNSPIGSARPAPGLVLHEAVRRQRTDPCHGCSRVELFRQARE